MKCIFIVQGEGRGHLTQCIALENILRSNGHEVVKVLVGKSFSRQIPDFFRRHIHAPIERFESPNFLPTPANKRNTLTHPFPQEDHYGKWGRCGHQFLRAPDRHGICALFD